VNLSREQEEVIAKVSAALNDLDRDMRALDGGETPAVRAAALRRDVESIEACIEALSALLGRPVRSALAGAAEVTTEIATGRTAESAEPASAEDGAASAYDAASALWTAPSPRSARATAPSSVSTAEAAALAARLRALSLTPSGAGTARMQTAPRRPDGQAAGCVSPTLGHVDP